MIAQEKRQLAPCRPCFRRQFFMIPLGPPPSVYAFPVHHPEMFAKVDGPDPGSEPQDLAGANRAGGGHFIMWSWSNCLHGLRAIAALAVVAALWSAASPAL